MGKKSILKNLILGHIFTGGSSSPINVFIGHIIPPGVDRIINKIFFLRHDSLNPRGCSIRGLIFGGIYFMELVGLPSSLINDFGIEYKLVVIIAG